MVLKIGTNQSIAADIYTLAAGENFLQPANVVSQTTGTAGVWATSGGHRLTIDGTLIGQIGVALGAVHGDFGNIMAISATGVIAGTTKAVNVFGGQVTINSAGLLAGNTGIDFMSDLGTRSIFTSSGRIIAEFQPILHSGAEKLTFTNSGTVTSYGIDSYSGSFLGIDVVINKGTMIGDIQLNGNNDVYEGNGGRVIGTVYGDVGSDSLRGGALVDRLTGNSGNDVLIGRGGKDILSGGADVDSFFYYNVTELGDTITDFTIADFLRFKSTAFGNATITVDHLCTAANFRSNLSGLAEDPTDRFIFETDRDVLWFDANGTGAGGRYLVTDFAYDVALTRLDIFIF